MESARFMSAGGIAGDNFRGVIRNCFNDSLLTVKGVGTDWSAGGIAGMNYEDAQIETSFNVGYFMASFLSEEDPGTPLPVGSISGMNEGTIAYCYYLEKTADMGVGTKDPDDDDNKVNTKQLSNQQMKTQESYIGFDFYRVWEIKDGKCPNFQSR